MTVLQWDQTGERRYETGVDHGVLYQVDVAGDYVTGKAWNGLTAVTNSPSGAESNKKYADNIEYLNLLSAEMFACTIEAFTYPEEFGQNDGTIAPAVGVHVGQQRRRTFGFCWRTRLGNDVEGTDYGYKLHLAWGCLASPSEKAYETINDSPEAIAFSWDVSTTPVAVGTISGTEYRPTAYIEIDSTTADPAKLAALEAILYGTVSTDPELPLPADVIIMMSTALTSVTPTPPTYSSSTDLITLPAVTGVEYWINGSLITTATYGPIAANTEVKLKPATGYKFPVPTQTQYVFIFA